MRLTYCTQIISKTFLFSTLVVFLMHVEKIATIFFQQNIIKVVHLEIVQGGLLNMFIPTNLLQHPSVQLFGRNMQTF